MANQSKLVYNIDLDSDTELEDSDMEEFGLHAILKKNIMNNVLYHVMIWGAICADRIGLLVVWDKEWWNITSKAYVEHITKPALIPWYNRQRMYSFPI